MKNYRLIVSYDGTRYNGWQVQKSTDNTIQGKLQNVLSQLTGIPIEVIGAGRTDAGVHAIGQCANAHLPERDKNGKKITPDLLLSELNRYLPEDVAVTSVTEVPERFHARFSAVEKTYRYRIHTSTIPNVFARRYVYTYTDYPLDLNKMRHAADFLEGTHDFAAFCGNKHMKKSTVRTISKICISRRDSEIILDFTGDGFLQNMVRILTGTLIEVASGRRDAESMTSLLESRKRENAGYTAPGQGLCLLEVNYPE